MGKNVEVGDFDPEEELIPVGRSPPKVQSPKRATASRVVQDDDDDDDDDDDADIC